MMSSLRTARNFALSFTSFVLSIAAVVGLISTLATYANRSAKGAPAPVTTATKAKKNMRSFGSDDELKSYLLKLVEEQRREQARRAKAESNAPVPAPATTDNQAATGLAKAADEKSESITNTQHAGVDEGGIVKLHGDHLVVLRRGRLFT